MKERVPVAVPLETFTTTANEVLIKDLNQHLLILGLLNNRRIIKSIVCDNGVKVNWPTADLKKIVP